VFVYPMAPYRYSERELRRNDFMYGRFGENFTAEGSTTDIRAAWSSHAVGRR
jgi:MOSC domain-containing protein YiiM